MRKGERLHDAQRYAVLAAVYASENRSVNARNVGAYRTKVVRAGEFLYISCYPLIGCGARRAQEERLDQLRGEAHRDRRLQARWNRYNNKRRCRDFEMLVHANFTRGDLHVCCTYAPQDFEGDPEDVVYRDRDDAKREIRNYIARVRRLLKRRGCDLSEFRWICCTVTHESLKEAARPRPDTHHHHLLFHGVPEILRTEVEELWGHGYCNADRLQPSHDKGVAAMAEYIARQNGNACGERHGEKSYSCSRNIKRPVESVSDVKISRRRVARIARDMREEGAEILEKIWKGYRADREEICVETSDFVAGAYIYARLRRTDSGEALWRKSERCGMKNTESAG